MTLLGRKPSRQSDPARRAGDGGGSAGADLSALARGGAFSLAGSGASALFTFVLVLVLTRGLGAAGAGLFFQASAVFAVLAAVSQLGADVGLVRTLSRCRALGLLGDVRPIIRLALRPVAAAGVIAGAAMFTLAPAVAELIAADADQGTAVVYLRVLALAVPVAAVSRAILSATRGLGALRPFVVIENIGRAGLQPLLALVAVTAALGAVALALSFALPFALAAAAGAVVLERLVRRSERAGRRTASDPNEARTLAGEFWRFSASRGVASVFQIAILWLDVILLGALASASAAGIYTAVSRYLIAGFVLVTAMMVVLGPQLAALLARGERDRAGLLYRTSTWWLTALAWPFYLMVAVFAPVFAGVFGAGFGDGETALVVLSLAMLVSTAAGPVTLVLLMGGKASWNVANTAAALTVNVALNLVLIPKLGITGAAIAWAATIVVNNLLPLAQAWLAFGLHPFGRGLLVPAGSAVLCYAVPGLAVREALGATAPALLIACAVGTGLYLSVLARFRAQLNLPFVRDALRPGAGRLAVAGETPGLQTL